MAKRYYQFVYNPFNPLGGVRIDFSHNSNGGTNYPCVDTALESFINKCNNAKLLAVVENDTAIFEAKRIAQEYKDAQAKANQWPEVVYSIHEGRELHKYGVVFEEEYAEKAFTVMVLDLDTNDKLFYYVDIKQHVTPSECLAEFGYYTSPELAVRAYKAKVAAQLDALLLKEPKDGATV